jgi:hypothetical protein
MDEPSERRHSTILNEQSDISALETGNFKYLNTQACQIKHWSVNVLTFNGLRTNTCSNGGSELMF